MSASFNITKAEYEQRMKNVIANAQRMKSKTHCINEHEFTPENTFLDKDGHRHCRLCRKHSGSFTKKRAIRTKWAKRGFIVLDARCVQCLTCKKKSPRRNPGKHSRHWELCTSEDSSN